MLRSILLTKKYPAHKSMWLSCFMPDHRPSGRRPRGKVVIQSCNRETQGHGGKPYLSPARPNYTKIEISGHTLVTLLVPRGFVFHNVLDRMRARPVKQAWRVAIGEMLSTPVAAQFPSQHASILRDSLSIFPQTKSWWETA